MSISSYKITDAAIAEKGVIAAPDKLTGTAAQNKALFDRLIREAVKTLFNSLIDTLASEDGAGEIGITEIGGVTGGDVQTALGSLKTLLDAKSAAADVTAALALKSDKSVTDLHVKSVSFDAQTGTFTFTKEDGSYTTVDTALEKVATNWQYDAASQSLVLTLADGTTQTVPLSAFITETEFADSGQIAFSVNGHMVTATVKAGSITDAMLSSALAAQLQGYVSAAAGSAADALQYKNAAEGFQTQAGGSAASASASASAASASGAAAEASAAEAESWAHGGTDSRPGEDTDNAMYWSNLSRANAGVVSFNGRNGNVTPHGGDYTAGMVSYDNTYSGLQAQDVQAALDDLAAHRLFARSFAANDWTAGADGVTLTIATSAHGITGGALLAQFCHLVGGGCVSGTWACLESRAEIDAGTHAITLRAPEAYAGKVVLYG